MNKERLSGHARRAGITSLAAIVAAMLAVSNFARVRGSASQEAATLKTVSDMVVIQEGPHAGTIFIADAEAGAIFFARPSSQVSTVRLPFADFQPFIMGDGLKRPRALAATAAKLYVGNDGENSLLEVDIGTRSPSVINHDRRLGAPTSMAVSAEGGIAITDGSPEVVRLAPGGKMEVVKHQFKGPRRVAFSGADLLVFDSDRLILRAGLGAEVAEPVLLPWGMGDALTDGRDFAAFRNLYYLTGPGRVVVSASNNSGAYRRFDTPLTLPLGDAALATSSPTLSRIFVTPDFLFVADTGAVWKLPRPVPVDVRFDGNAEQTSLCVAELLVYMHSQRMLTSRLFTAAQAYRSVEDVLREKRLLVAPLPAKGAGAPVRVRLGNLICELNREFCERNSTTGERILAMPVKVAETLRLPDVAINEYVTTKRINLDGRTVGEYVRRIFLTEMERDKYAGQARLERLNPPDPKVSRREDIFELKEGSFVLPVKRWQLSLLAPAGDLKSETSPLRRLSASYPDVYILSKEDFSNPKNSSFASPEKMFTPQEDKPENVVKNRDQLKKAINYPDAAFDMSRIYIGVAEDGVDFKHPDFINANGESVWFELTPDGSDLVRHPVEPGASPTPPKIGEAFISEDHGTHVAGLLGARPEGLVPGLLSSIKGLFLIDKSNASNLQEHINAARDAGPVFIYNFSFTFCDESAALDLKEKMLDDWKESLFVVAAGNARSSLPAEQDLNVRACPPVSWVESVKNMIGVGATVSTPDGEMVLMTPFIKNGITFEGSKYGKRFIQLVAPGREIYSLARGNAYKIASGTSQAVPQVTAAAAMLYSQNITNPVVIKARLIYTADWFPSLQEKVYGGVLNVRRAVWEPAIDLISPGDAPTQLKAAKLEGNPTVTIDGQLDEPGERGLVPSRRFQMKFRKILRISTLASGDGVLKRVFFIDDRGKLRIITNAIITGSVKCRETREWDNETKRFKAPEPCAPTLVLSELADYVMDVNQVPVTISF